MYSLNLKENIIRKRSQLDLLKSHIVSEESIQYITNDSENVLITMRRQNVRFCLLYVSEIYYYYNNIE